jgi:hypothetical protein
VEEERALPDTIVSDNGTELTSGAVLRWATRRVAWHYIEPGKPVQNDYVSHCTSLIPCDTMFFADRRVDSLTPCALRGGLLGGSYKESFLSL